jgi:dephospho-CoA kinase
MPDQNFQQRQDKRLVIGITGRIGAGKTSVGRYLESRYGLFYVRYSQVLSDWRAKDSESKAHLQAVGWEVMAGGKQVELNHRLIAHIQSQPRCAIDGLRHLLDQECLTKTFSPDFYLLYINSPEDTRWRRLQTRYPSLETFRAADSHRVEENIESLREHSYAVLENAASVEALYTKVDDILEKIRPGDQS